MEQARASSSVLSIIPSIIRIENPLCRHDLSFLRSLIINPFTPNSFISSIFEILTGHLEQCRDTLLLQHSLKLLSELAFHRPQLSHLIFQRVRSHPLSFESTHLAAESLDMVASIAEQDQALAPSSVEGLYDNIFVPLCFACSVSPRRWLLGNAERFHVRPHLLVTMFLGFTKDPYPYVRKAALDGLIELSRSSVFEDCSLIEGCYHRAIGLLNDMEPCVRSAAVRMVSQWGQILVASNKGMENREHSNALFVQLCSVVRDMSVEVRVEAFDALGKIESISVDILLQSLSKKVLGNMKEFRFASPYWGPTRVSASIVAGALVHGFEDEFYQVRRSVCHTLQRLCMLSSEFAGEAINLLMDMLNDDSMAVRLQALRTMHHMATCDHLSLQATHMHMFLGALADNNSLIRTSVRNVLKFAKLPSIEMFRLSVYGLIENLETYPQDELEIFSALFFMGQHHGYFAARISNEVVHELDPVSDGKLGFDCARIAALLVLSISAPPCQERCICEIPPRVFSYAVTLLGRISRALGDILSQDTLLLYLSQCSSHMDSKVTESGEHVLVNMARAGLSQGQDRIECMEIYAEGFLQPSERPWSPAGQLVHVHDDLTKLMSNIFAKVKDIWTLIKTGFLNEGLRALSIFKEELATLEATSVGSPAGFAFMLRYVEILKLLAMAWSYFLPAFGDCSGVVGQLDLILVKLERTLGDMRCRFVGLSKEVEFHLMELTLFSLMLKLSKSGIGCPYLVSWERLSTVLSVVDHLQREHTVESSFVTELEKLMHEIDSSPDNIIYLPFLIRKTLDSFSPMQLQHLGRLQSISAELVVPNNDSENPFPFVQGLPVAIQLEVNLCNVSRGCKLWLKMMVLESEQFIALDPEQFGESNELRKLTFVAPFCRTPKAVSFNLRICLGMECFFKNIHSGMNHGGPKYELTFLCPEIEVHFSTDRKLAFA